MAGLLGNIFGAIGKNQSPDIQSRPLSQVAEPLYDRLFADYQKSLGNQTSGLQDFSKQFQSLTPQLAGLDQLHASTYQNLIDQAKNYDPTANLRTSGDYLFGNASNFLKQGMDAGNAALKAQLANSGLGDRGLTGYGALLNANRVTSNFLPLISNIVSNLTPLTNQQNSSYFQNLANIPSYMAGQTNALQATPFRALVPSQIEQQQLLANLDALNKINAGNLSNRYFYNKPNIYSTIGDVASGAYQGIGDALDLVNKAASTYSNVLGAGSMGGLGGQRPQQQPDLSDGDNRNTGYFPGESLANMGVSQINTSGYPVGGQYGPLGVGGYSQYNPASALGGYQQPLPYTSYPIVSQPDYGPTYGGLGGYSAYNPASPLYSQLYRPQNPYGQYGAFFQ